jgi:hypothetical protein
MKKSYGLIAGIFLALFLISFVSAAFDISTMLKDAGSSVGSGINSLVKDTPAFIKTLFFILVFIIIASLIELIPLFREKRFMGIIVALIVSTLAVFFLPTSMMTSLVAPYSAMGVAFTSIIPFIFVFLFSKYMLVNKFLKNLVWFFFTIFLIILTVYDAINYPTQWFKWVYAIVSLLAIVMLYFNDALDRYMLGGKLEGVLTKAEQRIQREKAFDELREKRMKAEGI